MEICKLRIHNFRSIKDLTMDMNSMAVLLGENNAGKSNILAAIEFALTTSSSAKPTPDDWFAFTDDDDEELWVELTFHKLTEQEKRTFKKYVMSDGTICVRKTAWIDDSGKVQVKYNGYLEEPNQEWLKSSYNQTKREELAKTPLADYIPQKGRITQNALSEAKRAYIDDHREELDFSRQLEEGPFLGTRNVAAGTLPDFYLVPAIRDLSDESKVKNTTVFGRLLSRAINDMAQHDERFIGVQEQLQELINALNKQEDQDDRPQQLKDLENLLSEELSNWGVAVNIKIDPPDISKIFELGTTLYLDDGHETDALRKGHGLQRAVVFGLIKAWARVLRTASEDDEIAPRKASESIIFAIEEPELFLHPQAQRALADALRELSENDNHQVLLCSHSTFFVDLDHYNDIVIVTKPTVEEGTKIKQYTGELFEGKNAKERKQRFHMASWINPYRGEMFFAKKVVFVEGETETTIIPFLANKLFGEVTHDVSIIDCGSKFNLSLYIQIAEAFQLNYHVVHDEDPLPDEIPSSWNDDKIREKKRTYKENEQIAKLVKTGKLFICRPDFEIMSGVSKKQGSKKGKALAALDHFQNKSVDEIPEKLVELVRSVYTI